MTRIAVIQDQSGKIIDSRGINIRSLVDTTPVINIRTDANNNILSVNSHITLTDIHTTGVAGDDGDVDGGIF